MEPGTGLLVLIIFGVFLIVFLVWEMGQWRRAGSILSSRQKTLRLINIGVLFVILCLMAVSVMGYVKSALGQAIVLTAILLLTLVFLALGLRDYRELKATRYAREERIAGDVARLIAAGIKRAKAEEEAAQRGQGR